MTSLPGLRSSALLWILAAFLLGGIVCCSTAAPPPPPRDNAALKDDYLALQQKALAEVRAWSGGGARMEDPRPVWADRLEAFARSHADAPQAAEALQGVLQLRSASLDIEGFFSAYDLLLQIAPDSPGVSAAFPQITMMRMVQAGGPGIMRTSDHAAKQRAYRQAVPHIISDLESAIEATSNPATLAAAHYTIGSTYYQLDVNLPEALKHFRIVAGEHPGWSQADSAGAYAREIETLGEGRPAPDFEARTLEGVRISLASLRGKIVLVDFWATWCSPCVEELPNLKRAYDRFRARGFTILGISLDEDEAVVRKFVAEHGMTWPIIAAGGGTAGPLARAYSVQAIPMSYLIDRDGTIRGRMLFGVEVQRAVADLIGRQASASRSEALRHASR